ncbi:MAG: oxygenase MpaB family protein [Hyphomonadaceae bacterium]|nr:oxygenase MpaB family protein [Hyphomonadaceae bacterium]
MPGVIDQLSAYLDAPPGVPAVDFAQPAGAPALFAHDSLTWRVMKNPVALAVGGVAAVILELAEPRVRTGVWEHTAFRGDPVRRVRRTGYATMVTVYAPSDAARAMIARVNRMHAHVAGETPAGAAYRADNVELLNWVQGTAAWGFFEAYHRFVRPLSRAERDQLFAEGAGPSALYGATGAPRSAAEMDALFALMGSKLERSDIVFEFLAIMRAAPLLPVRALQRLIVRAAVEITPDWARAILGLDARHRLRFGEAALLSAAGAVSDRIVLRTAPPAQACQRMGLGAGYLYR